MTRESGFFNVYLFATLHRPDFFSMSDPYIEVAVVTHMNNTGLVFFDVQNHVVDPCLHVLADFVIHIAVHNLAPFLLDDKS